MQITDYEKEFVQRTKILLKSYQGDYELTNAVNCLLGLIILPNEIIEKTDESWDILLTDVKELEFLQIKVFDPIKNVRRSGEVIYFPSTLRIFLKKIRNGLAHQNIAPINENGYFVGIKIRNYFPNKTKIMDLEVVFQRKELEKFAIFIANKYLSQITP